MQCRTKILIFLLLTLSTSIPGVVSQLATAIASLGVFPTNPYLICPTLSSDCVTGPRPIGSDLTLSCPLTNTPMNTTAKAMTALQRIQAEGYTMAVNGTINTTQGYSLFYYRIPRSTPNSGVCCMVLHGILQSENDWQLTNNKSSLPIQMYEAGCEPWVFGLRGSLNSIAYTPTNGINQWNFEMDNIVKQDMPQMIGYMKQQGCSKINIIGLSLGSAAPLAYLSDSPANQNGICSHVAFNPAVNLNGSTSLATEAICAAVTKPLVREANTAVIPSAILTFVNPVVGTLANQCAQPDLQACECIFNNLFGTNGHPSYTTNENILNMALNRIPNGVSMKTLVQLCDNLHTGNFTTLKDGQFPNQVYNLANINTTKTKIVVYSGKCDSLVLPTNVERMILAMNGNVTYFSVDDMNHVDPTYGTWSPCLWSHAIGQMQQAGCI